MIVQGFGLAWNPRPIPAPGAQGGRGASNSNEAANPEGLIAHGTWRCISSPVAGRLERHLWWAVYDLSFGRVMFNPSIPLQTEGYMYQCSSSSCQRNPLCMCPPSWLEMRLWPMTYPEPNRILRPREAQGPPDNTLTQTTRGLSLVPMDFKSAKHIPAGQWLGFDPPVFCRFRPSQLLSQHTFTLSL